MYLIEHPGFYARADIYGEHGKDYPDNVKRFIFFSRAAALAAAEIVRPDVMHAHDWHAAYTPGDARRPDAARYLQEHSPDLHDSQSRLPGNHQARGLRTARYRSILQLARRARILRPRKSDEGCDRPLRR